MGSSYACLRCGGPLNDYDIGWMNCASALGGFCTACFTKTKNTPNAYVDLYVESLLAFEEYIDGL